MVENWKDVAETMRPGAASTSAVASFGSDGPLRLRRQREQATAARVSGEERREKKEKGFRPFGPIDPFFKN